MPLFQASKFVDPLRGLGLNVGLGPGSCEPTRQQGFPQNYGSTGLGVWIAARIRLSRSIISGDSA